MSKKPEFVNATQAELDALLALAKPTFPQAQYALLEAVLATFVVVMSGLQNAKTSIQRFRQMLFGAKTESQDNLIKEQKKKNAADVTAPPTTAAEGQVNSASPPPPPRSGHGRNGADKYCNADIVPVVMSGPKAGDLCPECGDANIYASLPRTLVKVVGQPPLVATIYTLEQLRCRLCDATFTASLPAGVSSAKYDVSCASMLAILRYGSGMPFYRLESLQASLNVPLPDSTQWDIVANAVPAPKAVFAELVRQAAQAPLLHTDDTPAKILSLMADRTRREAAGEKPEVVAMNTSGIVAVLPEERKVALFFTGHPHAGNNLTKVLAQRAVELTPPMQMSDALAANFVGAFKTVVGNCLGHGRRNFVDVVEHFPEPCLYVINLLAQVYANDAHCRNEKMSPDERLLHHQSHSAPLMKTIHDWASTQLNQRLVEPNSGLGKALRYLLKHWNRLTLFLRQAGAPLDNNICERALKKAVLQRKNSMFYKTQNGAEVGDIYMSLIHTCELCCVNPFEYLQALQSHAEAVMAKAALWLPWNYREQLPARQ